MKIGEVTNTGDLKLTALGGEINVATKKAEELWEEAIPMFKWK